MSQRSARNDAAPPAKQGRGETSRSGSHQIASKRPSREAEQASVQAYLDRFAEAMTAGDTKTMAKLWGVPAFVIGATEARAVQSETEVEQFFAGAKDMYNERGIVGTRAEISDLDWVGEDLVIATVRWPYLDENERVLGEESSSYTLLRGEDGSFKLRVITMRGASPLETESEREHAHETNGDEGF
jgi:ketosteroid isomerase-like protein